MKRIRNSAKQLTLGARWILALGSIAVAALAADVGLLRMHAQQTVPLPAVEPPAATSSPAAEQPAKQQTGTSAADADGPVVAKECSDLLKMASELKTAVDQSSAGTLSVTVVRKAAEIEQFAHKVRVAKGPS
jgi:hypothetical protein